jgi:hypothetical protein
LTTVELRPKMEKRRFFLSMIVDVTLPLVVGGVIGWYEGGWVGMIVLALAAFVGVQIYGGFIK